MPDWRPDQRLLDPYIRAAENGHFIPDDDDPPRFGFVSGGSFVLDAPAAPVPIWGAGDDVLLAEGESLLIAGAQGVGKSGIGQQLALGMAGMPGFEELLGFPITPVGKVLYLAMDRPAQIRRSMRRMVGEPLRRLLNERLVVWEGPPPQDLARHPDLMAEMTREAEAGAVLVDSTKDAAMKLTDDEVGALWNRARQTVLRDGAQVVELHHQRKVQAGQQKEPKTLDSIYGSTWITSGCGSVIYLDGEPGDPVVGLRHMKQPAEEVGPLRIVHDPATGRSDVWHSVDLVVLARAGDGITAIDAAKALFDTDKPTPAQRERARRRLERLAATEQLYAWDKGDKATNRPAVWRTP